MHRRDRVRLVRQSEELCVGIHPHVYHVLTRPQSLADMS